MNRIYQGKITQVEIPDPATKGKQWLLFHPDTDEARRLTGRIPELRKKVDTEITERAGWPVEEQKQKPKSPELVDYEKLRAQQRQQWQDALWEHHQLFQDAVNYYTVAIAALGFSDGSRLTGLRRLLAQAWNVVEKQGERRDGIGESFKRIMQRDARPAIDDVVKWFVDPLNAAGVEPLARELAGESLLHDLGGAGSIQQGGKEYWPYFCQSGFERGVQFPRASAQLLKETAEEKLPSLLRHPRIGQHAKLLKRVLRTEMFANADKNGAAFDPAVSAKQLRDAATYFRTQLTDEEAMKLEKAISEASHSVSKYVGSSINKPALKARMYAFLIFKHLESNAKSIERLANCYPAPKTTKAAKRKKPTEKEKIEARLCSMGVDPIEAVRRKSRIVFRAFTALPAWQELRTASSIDPADHERSNYESEITESRFSRIGWKDFDVAAFKETLTVVNQFNQNVTKREAKLNEFATRLLFMDGEKVISEYNGDSDIDRRIRKRLQDIWAITKGKPKLTQAEEESDGESTVLPKFADDPRIDRLKAIVSKDLAEEYRLTEGRTTPYGLRRRTMKGWSEVKRKWQSLVKAGISFSNEKKSELQASLDELRKSKSEQIGSHKLYEALIVSEESWRIWREPTEKAAEDIATKGWATDPLESFRLFCETKETLEDLSQRSLNFTPADARRSRRLFGFKEVCSFGKSGGEFKHDTSAMAVTVPTVLKNKRGVLEKATIRISYGAPRLLRDQVRDAKGAYIQSWIQPMVEALCPEQTKLSRQQLDDAAVELMPDWSKDDKQRFLLNFSFDLQPQEIVRLLPKTKNWDQVLSGPDVVKRFNQDEIRLRQFVAWDKGEVLTFLRWQSELHRHLGDTIDAMKKHRAWTEKNELSDVVAAFASASSDEDRIRIVRQFIDATPVNGENEKEKKLRRSLEYSLLCLEHAWWRRESLNGFQVLATDLGTRHGATVARIEASSARPTQPSTARLIGESDGRTWYARFVGGKILRLSGEDAKVVRYQTEQDLKNDPEGETRRAEKDFREELYGDQGRLADGTETRVFFEMLKSLDQLELLPEVLRTTDTLAELRRALSFPEQNDKCIIAIRRTQGHLADLISQHWRLVKPEQPEQTDTALKELSEQERYPVLASMAADVECRDELIRLIGERIEELRKLVQQHLLTLTEKILPMRGRVWQFDLHNDNQNFPDCHLLQAIEKEGEPIDKWLRGQRGISLARIEQLSELRRRWQSLNQSLRRKIGERPLTAAQMREKPIPDPCPAILRKLEELRDQRVNQIAHLILAEALGLELRIPQKGKDERRASDIHGEYRRCPGRESVDFIVLEHLNRYKANQGRAKSENTRLMQWCHRQVVAKIKELAETFGIPILETPAAYSSRFCSLTGAAGFRAVEVNLADRGEYRWRKLLNEAKEKGGAASVEAKSAARLFLWLEQANDGKTGKEVRTLIAPQVGGSMFVTAVPVAHPAPNAKREEKVEQRRRERGVAPKPFWVAPIQADLGAAITLGFRAIAHPDRAEIHHRVRSERITTKKGEQNQDGAADTYRTREKRRFGESQPMIKSKDDKPLPKERNPNLFYDAQCVAQFDRVRLESDLDRKFPYATGRGLWKRVNDWEFQWARCEELNKQRLQDWEVEFTEAVTNGQTSEDNLP